MSATAFSRKSAFGNAANLNRMAKRSAKRHHMKASSRILSREMGENPANSGTFYPMSLLGGA